LMPLSLALAFGGSFLPSHGCPARNLVEISQALSASATLGSDSVLLIPLRDKIRQPKIITGIFPSVPSLLPLCLARWRRIYKILSFLTAALGIYSAIRPLPAKTSSDRVRAKVCSAPDAVLQPRIWSCAPPYSFKPTWSSAGLA